MTRVALRVSHLDQWLWYRRSETMGEDEFIARLEGRAPASEAARVGTAFHAALEDEIAKLNRVGSGWLSSSILTHGDISFFFGLSDFHIAAGGVRTEVRASALLEDVADGVDVQLTGHADALRGRRIWDWKTTSKPIDLERYQRSMQWRSYLMLHDGDKFTYRVYRLGNPSYGDTTVYKVIDEEKLDCWRYPEMEDDVRRVAGELGEWCAGKGVLCV